MSEIYDGVEKEGGKSISLGKRTERSKRKIVEAMKKMNKYCVKERKFVEEHCCRWKGW